MHTIFATVSAAANHSCWLTRIEKILPDTSFHELLLWLLIFPALVSAANKASVCQLPFKSQARISLLEHLNIPFYKWCTKEYFVLKPLATDCSHNDDLEIRKSLFKACPMMNNMFFMIYSVKKVLNLQTSSIISTLNLLLLLNAWWNDAPNDAKLAYPS